MSAGNTVVTVPLGAQVTCTIINTDNTPTLKLVKIVSGGIGDAEQLHAGGCRTGAEQRPELLQPRRFGCLPERVRRNATYTLSEIGPAGYTASAWSCDGGTQVGATIQVPLGVAVTCTITNTRDVGTSRRSSTTT